MIKKLFFVILIIIIQCVGCHRTERFSPGHYYSQEEFAPIITVGIPTGTTNIIVVCPKCKQCQEITVIEKDKNGRELRWCGSGIICECGTVTNYQPYYK